MRASWLVRRATRITGDSHSRVDADDGVVCNTPHWWRARFATGRGRQRPLVDPRCRRARAVATQTKVQSTMKKISKNVPVRTTVKAGPAPLPPPRPAWVWRPHRV